MKKVEPYRSFDGASRALDNGGRLWNVFTHASDRVITKAEVAAAGAGRGWASALLYFDLATSALADGEREELVRRLELKLRRRWRRRGPLHVSPGELDTLTERTRPYVTEGRLHRLSEAEHVVGFIPTTTMVGNVPVTTMTPITATFTAFEVTGEDGRVGRALARKGTPIADGVRVRLGGVLQEGRSGPETGSPRRNFLSVRYHVPLA